jgi:hypothetical protein
VSQRAQLADAVDRLVSRVSHWTPSRWAASSRSGPARAEIVYGLVQRVADRAADAEGQPRRVVPRLPSDLALPDQLRVVSADLLTFADPSVCAEVAEAVRQAHRAL